MTKTTEEERKRNTAVETFLAKIRAQPDRDLNNPIVWADIQAKLNEAIRPEIEKEERIRTALMGGGGLLKTVR